MNWKTWKTKKQEVEGATVEVFLKGRQTELSYQVSMEVKVTLKGEQPDATLADAFFVAAEDFQETHEDRYYEPCYALPFHEGVAHAWTRVWVEELEHEDKEGEARMSELVDTFDLEGFLAGIVRRFDVTRGDKSVAEKSLKVLQAMHGSVIFGSVQGSLPEYLPEDFDERMEEQMAVTVEESTVEHLRTLSGLFKEQREAEARAREALKHTWKPALETFAQGEISDSYYAFICTEDP